MRKRQHKANAKDHDICLWLLHNDEYKRKHGLKLVQNSLVPLDYPYNAVNVLINHKTMQIIINNRHTSIKISPSKI